jgi:hypothetical protein
MLAGTPLRAIAIPDGGALAGVTVKVAVLVVLPENAVIVTGVLAATEDVITGKLA